MDKEEQSVYINSELIAFQVAGVLSKNNERYIDESLVYEAVKSYVQDDSLIDDVYRATIRLLEEKYGVLFDLDKKVDV